MIDAREVQPELVELKKLIAEKVDQKDEQLRINSSLPNYRHCERHSRKAQQ
jgi:hypothetical protein